MNILYFKIGNTTFNFGFTSEAVLALKKDNHIWIQPNVLSNLLVSINSTVSSLLQKCQKVIRQYRICTMDRSTDRPHGFLIWSQYLQHQYQIGSFNRRSKCFQNTKGFPNIKNKTWKIFPHKQSLIIVIPTLTNDLLIFSSP